MKFDPFIYETRWYLLLCIDGYYFISKNGILLKEEKILPQHPSFNNARAEMIYMYLQARHKLLVLGGFFFKGRGCFNFIFLICNL